MSRVLLVDDDEQVTDVVKTTLGILGHTVCTATRPEDAKRLFASFRPDVTLVDYLLPNYSGLALLKELGEDRPGAVCYLATGLADFDLLKKALEAGASSMLCKPYRVSDLADLLQTASLLTAALAVEGESPESDLLRLNCPAGAHPDRSDLARLIGFARAHGASEDVSRRRLPIVATELMRNAGTHGSKDSPCRQYQVQIVNEEAHLVLEVSDDGPGFDHAKTLARVRGMDCPRVSGLQLVAALSDSLTFERGGRTVCARVRRHNWGQTNGRR